MPAIKKKVSVSKKSVKKSPKTSRKNNDHTKLFILGLILLVIILIALYIQRNSMMHYQNPTNTQYSNINSY
jgi:hypothetical protein